MDAEIIEKVLALEATVAEFKEQLEGLFASKPSAEVICMKEAAARLGISRHTMRRRALADPSLGRKIGGRWQFPA
jgi:predicted double-glycine peptidase